MTRRVFITGLGAVCGLGIGIEPTWRGLTAGHSAIGSLQAFDPEGLPCRIAAEVRDLQFRRFLPKHYRKAAKVMARDIELAVAAASLAAQDAKLVTRSSGPDAGVSYDPTRVGAHIGAGLIAADLDELTAALSQAVDDRGRFSYHLWGSRGLENLTPLWLLKYLPNMLACHVTIIHDAQGPSNTITCAEASAVLSIGESLRVIQRGDADLCFCGGAESKLNPMAYLRQVMTGRLTTGGNDEPRRAVGPFDQSASGTVIGEGGGIVMLEAAETFTERVRAGRSHPRAELAGSSESAPPPVAEPPRAYAEVIGFGASQSVNRAARNLEPDPEGRGITLAIRAALREAGVTPDQIDLVIPFGSGIPVCDRAEAAALRQVFADYSGGSQAVPVVSNKAVLGSCGAGSGGLDVCSAAAAVAYQTIPATINCDQPLPGVGAGTSASRSAPIRHALVYSTGVGGHNAALVLKHVESSER